MAINNQNPGLKSIQYKQTATKIIRISEMI